MNNLPYLNAIMVIMCIMCLFIAGIANFNIVSMLLLIVAAGINLVAFLISPKEVGR